MMQLGQIITQLNQQGALPDASRKTGIAYAQLWRLAKGRTPNPTYKTLKALSEYFSDSDGSGDANL